MVTTSGGRCASGSTLFCSLQATFGVTLVRPSDGYIALSNMPVDKEVAESPAQGMTEVQVGMHMIKPVLRA